MDDWKEAKLMEIKRLELLKADLVALTSKLSQHLEQKDKDLFVQIYAQLEVDIAKHQMDLEIDDILRQ